MKIIILTIFTAVIAVGAFFLATKKTPPVSPLPSPESRIVNTLLQGGNSFADPKGVYVFLYPNDYKQDSQNDGQYTRIYKTGKTQQGQTEMYDGVNVNFESLDLKGQTLEQWVDAHINNMTADSSIEVTQPKKPITINGYPGFSYSIRGLGESQYLALQKDADSSYAVSIIYMVSDPGKVGFQTEVDATLSTLELLK